MSDLTPPVEQPVTIAASSLPEASMTLLRYALTAIGGIMVTRGWLSDQTVNDLIGVALILAPTH